MGIFDTIIHRWAIVNWSVDLTLNTSVTLAIVLRLWMAGRSVSGISLQSHRYKNVISTVVESGLLFATATLITVSLYLSGNTATPVAIDSVVQIAVSFDDFDPFVCWR